MYVLYIVRVFWNLVHVYMYIVHCKNTCLEFCGGDLQNITSLLIYFSLNNMQGRQGLPVHVVGTWG